MNFKEMMLKGILPDNLQVLDAHGHIGIFPGTVGCDGGYKKLIEVMDKRGILKTAVSSTYSITGDYIAGNNDMLEAVSNSQGRILGYVTVNPNYPEDSVNEIKRCTGEGVIGIKIHPTHSKTPVNHENYKPCFSYANERGAIVLVHVYSLDAVKEIEKTIVAWPNAKIIIAHSGTESGYALTAELIKKYENAYCDICMGYPRANLLEHLVKYGDDNKILFGSDTPLTDPGTSFGRIMLSDIPDSSKEKILGLNFIKMLENCSL
ncbi:MAG: hypothetical protein E7411_00900 [Ruminococcaceae bacterium]|nr:hypothetical protein [Oscillospiraceae bacterium]